MPYCPDCKTEYRDGFETCADCGAILDPGPLPSREPKLWKHLSPPRTVLEVGLVALLSTGVACVAFVACLVLAFNDPCKGREVSHGLQRSYITLSCVALLGILPLAGYLHARLLQRLMNLKPIMLGWLIGSSPVIAWCCAAWGHYGLVGLFLVPLGVMGSAMAYRHLAIE